MITSIMSSGYFHVSIEYVAVFLTPKPGKVDSVDGEILQCQRQGNWTQITTDKVWDFFSLPQKEKLKQFKAQINRISLDSLLRYVYTKYPDDAVNSVIADKYLKKADE